MYFQRSKYWPELNWPQVYKPALEMLTVLLQSKKHLFLDEMITFIGIHEEHVTACVMDVRHSLDKWSLDLAVTALTLIRELSQFKDMWRLAHEKSMFAVVVSRLNLRELWRFLCLYVTEIYPCNYKNYVGIIIWILTSWSLHRIIISSSNWIKAEPKWKFKVNVWQV